MKNVVKVKLLQIAVFILLVTFFQNCAGSNPFESSSSQSNEKSSGNSTIGGNGEPYGGKIGKYQSYMEGFYCTSSDGQKVASPYSIIEKTGDSYKLVKQACEDKNELVNPITFIENPNNNTATYDFRRFYKNQDFINDVLIPKFNFDESFCDETIESRMLRKYGTANLTPDKLKTAKADYVEIKVFSMFYGYRFAEIRITKDLPLIISAPDANLVIESYKVDISSANIQLDNVVYAAQSTNSQLSMTIGRNKNIPTALKANYEGVLNYTDGSVNLSNIQVSCPIYPHF